MQANQEPGPTYLHRYPFRLVEPYAFTYRTFTKGRWIGKPLLATLAKQFKAFPAEYYAQAVETGKITVNGQQVHPEYLLKNGDQIIHQSVRVEPPVLDLPIRIVHESDDYLVIDKPPSLTVHTGGGHHYNTVASLLKYQHHYQNLHILHRLDKNTSGLLIFAKNKQKVGLFHEESGNELMKKMYYARVTGNFPWPEKQLSAYIKCLSQKDGIYRVTQEIKIEKLIQSVNTTQKAPKEASSFAENNQFKQQKRQQEENEKPQKKKTKQDKEQLKDSRTIFKRVWYDEETDSSLLECYPVTGRTHQIRVHLQFLGFPILNDTVYGGRFVGNKIIQSIGNHPEDEQQVGLPRKKIKPNQQIKVQDWDYETRPWQLMLHSFKYKFGGQQFQTKPPYWLQRQNIGYKVPKK